MMIYLLRCRSPLMALSGRRWAADQCPFSGVKQTSQIHGAHVRLYGIFLVKKFKHGGASFFHRHFLPI